MFSIGLIVALLAGKFEKPIDWSSAESWEWFTWEDSSLHQSSRVQIKLLLPKGFDKEVKSVAGPYNNVQQIHVFRKKQGDEFVGINIGSLGGQVSAAVGSGGMSKESAESAALYQVMHNSAKALGGTIDSSNPIKLGSVSGYESRVIVPSSGIIVRQRHYLRYDTLHHLVVIYKEGSGLGAYADKFFDSFQMTSAN